jgi:hypothetical protein
MPGQHGQTYDPQDGSWRVLGAKQEEAMGYIISGTNTANKEKPSSSNQVATAMEAWEKVVELQKDGYTVRATSSDGADIDLDDLKVRALAAEGP